MANDLISQSFQRESSNEPRRHRLAATLTQAMAQKKSFPTRSGDVAKQIGQVLNTPGRKETPAVGAPNAVEEIASGAQSWGAGDFDPTPYTIPADVSYAQIYMAEQDAFEQSVTGDKRRIRNREVAAGSCRATRAQNEAATGGGCGGASTARTRVGRAQKAAIRNIEAVPIPKLAKTAAAAQYSRNAQADDVTKNRRHGFCFYAPLGWLIEGPRRFTGLKPSAASWKRACQRRNVEQAGAALRISTAIWSMSGQRTNTRSPKYNAIIGSKKYSLEVQDRMFRQKALEMQDELSDPTA